MRLGRKEEDSTSAQKQRRAIPPSQDIVLSLKPLSFQDVSPRMPLSSQGDDRAFKPEPSLGGPSGNKTTDCPMRRKKKETGGGERGKASTAATSTSLYLSGPLPAHSSHRNINCPARRNGGGKKQNPPTHPFSTAMLDFPFD